jgi:hypothetical protein
VRPFKKTIHLVGIIFLICVSCTKVELVNVDSPKIIKSNSEPDEDLRDLLRRRDSLIKEIEETEKELNNLHDAVITIQLQ